MASSIEHKNRDVTSERLQTLINRIAAAGSTEFFDILTKELAHALDAKFCFISELLDEEGKRAQMLSFWMGERHGPTSEYSTEGTPCEHVPDQPVTFYPDRVAELFPADPDAVSLNIKSYLAVPFYDADGKPLGHVCIMDVEPMQRNINQEIIMTIISVRAAAEVQRYRYERNLVHIATHDDLTGLLNRSIIWDRIEHALERAQRNENIVGIVYIDIDDFKLVNDRHGHQTGDYLLVTTARSIRSSIRNSDSACRIGGDEFLVVLEDAENTQVIQSIVGNLYDNLNHKQYELNNHKIELSSSIGFSCYPIHSTSAKQLVNMADNAMYQAKAGKKGYQEYQLP